MRTRVVTVLAGAARDVGVYDDPLPYAEAFHVAKLVLGAAPLLGVDLSTPTFPS